MVREQVYGLADVFRQRFKSILKRVGTTIYSLYSITETRNKMGRISGRTESSSPIEGFLHKITPQDKLFLDLGLLNIGDGVFYCEYDVSINENDEVREAGETDRWILTSLSENEKIQGNKVFQAWKATKRV